MNLSLRAPQPVVERLDALREARGLGSRSEALRWAVMAASDTKVSEGPPDRDELLRLLGMRAREGHVAAIKALLDEIRRDEKPRPLADPMTEFDELAARRAQGRSA